MSANVNIAATATTDLDRLCREQNSLRANHTDRADQGNLAGSFRFAEHHTRPSGGAEATADL